ncbi:MAG: ATP-dependent DNA helicase [Flavobacteriaceae bacterium]|nr:ATP-dependent DNA helicase [Flavobacteriaceae bacterium]
MEEAEAAKGSLDCSKIDLRRELKKHFGFERFKSYQTDKQKFNQGNVINSLLKGHDVFVIMPTGGGKSLCYQLPAILTERKVAFVISPLIALMKNQVDAIRGNAQDDSVAHVMNSTLSKKDRDQVLKDLKESKTKLLYVAPESFSKESNLEEFKKLDVSFVAIDEAHCISEWGHDFRPEYRNIRKTVDLLGENIPVMALTATATKKVQKDIIKNLRMEAPHVFKASFNRSNLYYEVRPKTAEVNNEIVRFIKQSPERKSGIIYCLARKDTEYVASVLQENGINALPYHAGLKAKERVEHQEKFLNDRCDVMVATIAFGLGIDKPDVRYVIHHSIPKNIESYYQETGRAGRDGKEGHCLAFFNEKDIEKLESFSDSKTIIEKERNGYLLEEMVGYVETAISRRKFLLNYFGEKFDNETGPGGDLDDNVRFPKKLIEVKKEFKTLLDVIEQTKANYKTKELAKILSGKTNALIKSHETEKTSFFGIGKERKEEWWKSLIRQSIVKEYLKKNIENYGVVEITEKGNRVKKQNKEIFISEPQIVQAGRQQSSSDSVKMMSDPLLLKILMETRKKVAREKNVPPYTVFQESSLEEMCLKYPITKKELLGIAGVGVGKAEKFGQPFIDVIQDYVKENDVVRPDDLIIKTKKTNSLLKPLIIQSIDKKLSLEEITGAQKISRENLLEEMEKIVKSGTKLDIYNWVEDLFDEEAEDQLYDFLIQEESDDFQKLMDEFGDRYEEEDLRVFRLYFMSQTAN